MAHCGMVVLTDETRQQRPSLRLLNECLVSFGYGFWPEHCGCVLVDHLGHRGTEPEKKKFTRN